MNQVLNLFDRVNFRPSQLVAIRTLYQRYFAPAMPTFYRGQGVIAIWGDVVDAWRPGQGPDQGHNHEAILSPSAASDPLWQEEFGDLLPHMGTHATITRMPAGEVMKPHVDRRARPNAIYFPIDGCTEQCISDYYDLPISRLTSIAQVSDRKPPSMASYAITDAAVLTNVHAWHGVENHSAVTRTALGWNWQDASQSYGEQRQILKNLGYIHD